MFKNLLFLFVLICAANLGLCQNTRGDLAVYIEKTKLTAPVLAAIEASSPDTNRVNLLNKLSHIYWYQKTISNVSLDSCQSTAKAALNLSRELQFTEGINESTFIICKILLEKNNIPEAMKLAQKSYGEQKSRLLLVIAEPYVFNFSYAEREFLKAQPLAEQAKREALKVHSLKWTNESSNLLAKMHFKQGDLKRGKQDYLEIIANYQRLADYENVAKYWSRLGAHMPENNNSYPDIINAQRMAVKYYLLAGNKKEAGYSLRDLAMIRGNHNQTVQGEKDLMQMLRLFKEVGERLSATTYYILCDFYRFTGNYDKSLYYGLGGLRAAGDDTSKQVNPSVSLAATYALLKDYPKAIHYYQFVLNYRIQRKLQTMFIAAYKLGNVYAESGDPKRALSFLNQFLSNHPPTSINYQELFASTYGNIYNLMGKYTLAEKYYVQMLNLDDQANQENGENLGTHITLAGSGAYYIAGKFYASRGRYKEAKKYLMQSLENPQYFDKDQEVDTYRLLYQADYALGNYRVAIDYFAKHKELTDSMNSISRTNQISELNIKYDSEQKAKEIRLLEKNQHLQQLAVQRSQTIRNYTFMGAFLIFLLAATSFVGFRSKQRNNKQLQLQQEEINSQNSRLQSLLLEKDQFLVDKDGLIEEKDDLLKEKDWLLKEVHHRVKNNLQIIMSLLRTQLAHLKTEDAKDAILESEGRVQAIALIHHKLYNTDNLASIGMPEYVADLINYLSDGLISREKKVRFQQAVEPIYVDLAQAVPLGLILNEAITNAIKYGVNNNEVDINVAFRRLEDTRAILTIADQGPGVPEGFDLNTTKSLGMQMMKGLSKQLRGDFELTSCKGLTVSVAFNLIPVLAAAMKKKDQVKSNLL